MASQTGLMLLSFDELSRAFSIAGDIYATFLAAFTRIQTVLL